MHKNIVWDSKASIRGEDATFQQDLVPLPGMCVGHSQHLQNRRVPAGLWRHHGEGLHFHHGDVVRLLQGIKEEGVERLLSEAKVEIAMGKALTVGADYPGPHWCFCLDGCVATALAAKACTMFLSWHWLLLLRD